MDWFLFETKMRTMVREILEPVVERNEFEAEKYLALDRKANQITRRLEILEYGFLNEQHAAGEGTKLVPSVEGFIRGTTAKPEEAKDEKPPEPVPAKNVFESIFERISFNVSNDRNYPQRTTSARRTSASRSRYAAPSSAAATSSRL